MSFKKFSSFFLRFGISFILLAVLFWRMDIGEMLRVLASADVLILAAAFGIFILNNFVLFVRWVVVMRGLKLDVPLLQAGRSYMVGLFGNVCLPSAVGGDIYKAVTLCGQSTERTKVVASVLLDRLSGFTGIVIMALGSFMIGYKMTGMAAMIIPVLVLGGASLAAILVLFNRPVYEWMCGAAGLFPKLKEKLILMHGDIAMLKASPWHGAGAVVISMVGQFLYICTFFFIAQSLGQHVSFGYFCVFVPLLCVISMVPSIGGLGVREAGSDVLFSSVGVAKEIAVGMSLMVFVFMVIIGLIGGLVYVVTLYPRRVQRSS